MPRVSYFSISADDTERAMTFYREVFGWQFTLGWEYEAANGRERYWHVTTGDDTEQGINGGLTRREFANQPIGVGIAVDDLDVATARIETRGGKILLAKTHVSNRGWFAVCQDSEGNTIVVYTADRSAH